MSKLPYQTLFFHITRDTVVSWFKQISYTVPSLKLGSNKGFYQSNLFPPRANSLFFLIKKVNSDLCFATKKRFAKHPQFPPKKHTATQYDERTLFRKSYDSLFVGHSNVDVENPYKSWEAEIGPWILDLDLVEVGADFREKLDYTRRKA